MSIDNQYVTFFIIKRNGKDVLYKRIMILIILSFIGFVMLFPDRERGTALHLLILFSFIILLLVASVKYQLLKEHDEIGNITLFPDCMQITKDDQTTELPIEQVDLIEFEFKGYANQPVIGQTIQSKKGLENFVTIKRQNYVERFEVLVTNQYKINVLDRLLDHYRIIGLTVLFKDKSSQDSENSLIARLLLSFRQFFNY